MITLFDIGALLPFVLIYKLYSFMNVDEQFFWVLLAFTLIFCRYSNSPKIDLLKTKIAVIIQVIVLYLIMRWDINLACSLLTSCLLNVSSDTTNIYLFGSKYSRFNY